MPSPPGSRRRVILPGDGKEVVLGILGVDATFDRRAALANVLLAERKRLAGRDLDLCPHEVDAGDHFGDRMLDLDARVHLEEIEVALGIDEELDRAGADVVDGLGRLHGDPAHGLARLRVERGRGRLLDHLLVAALDRALALVDVNDVAVLVAEHLHLDVARRVDEASRRRCGRRRTRSWPRSAPPARRRGSRCSDSTSRMPLPPPPAAAFSMTGKPIFTAAETTSSSLSIVPCEPGTTGTPAAIMRLRASTLSPIASIASGDGPMNTRPASAQARAKCARSERKP